MVCPYCTGKTEVVNSRHQKRLNQVWRRRRCLSCGAVYSTHEKTAYDSVWRVQTKKALLQPFSEQKLLIELYKACEHRPSALDDAAALTGTVISQLKPQATSGVVQSSVIAQTMHQVLQRFDTAAASYYQAWHLS